MTPEPGAYVARYGWNRRSGLLIIGALLFVVVGVTAPMSLAMRVVTIVFFGAGTLVFIASIATRRVALQLDSRGVTLGGSPARKPSRDRLIPWAEVSEIVLWRQPMPYGRSMRYVGVARHKQAASLAGRRSRRASQATASALALGVSGDTLLASRAVNLWHLDTHRLSAAVAHFAPGVRIIDQDNAPSR
jgi:hypothetical protein